MLSTPAYAAEKAGAQLRPLTIQRREPGPHDVLIDIQYCGVCHSDIHQVRDEWGGALYPMVPGHEIVGTVAKAGASVTKHKPGETVGVSVLVDSCRKCPKCKAGEENYCENHISYTYNGTEQDGRTPTYGGYSTQMTVDENYVLRIPDGIPPDRAAPLLCAGITTYSPLRHFGVKPGDKVGVVGLGGLGHLGVKFARALGADVSVVSRTSKKRQDAVEMGAKGYISTEEDGAFETNARSLDFLLDTVSGSHDYNTYMKLLRNDGTMILVGLPDPTTIRAQTLVDRRLRLTGSSAGGIRETQEMLDFSAENGISADIETIAMKQVNEAFERTIRGDVRYRFVIDIGTLRNGS
ncbi:MAG TPA: NAD(P)-dependent alcohol dehydrogenase [Nitrososphaerales archaeon]|nr:NAD(P)-dependent alcohol dehydrogenase [Nitrososphaerales archaeon]